jgi:hypothetical protein
MHALPMIGLTGLIAVAIAYQAPAEEPNRTIRAAEAIIHPADARRFEELAHRNQRPEEQRYWHDYGAGLQRQGYHPADARQFEKEAHQNRRPDEERYWHQYGVGLQKQGYRDER